MSNLEKIGYNAWLKENTDSSKLKMHELARVIAVHKDRYSITNGEIETLAELSGSLMYNTDSALDLPTVGDWVYANLYDDDTHAIIHGVLPRQTVLKRKTAGKQVDYQLIAANIDSAFIVQSVNENINIRRLERYLVMVNESHIQPIVLLSKTDLIPQSELDEIIQNIKVIAPNVSIIAFSNITLENTQQINELLIAGKSYCMMGSSGVGKTTLLNTIIGESQFKTKEVSTKQSKGKHTTTSRNLVMIENGAMMIDTPGMRELGNFSVDEGLDETFAEIIELNTMCKFSNCSHSNEKGCAILSAIESGRLSQDRYNNYVKMKKESDFNDMSYQEKRNKDKQFGKMIKKTLKSKDRYL